MRRRALNVLVGGALMALIGLFAWAHLGAQSTGTLAPVEKRQWFDANGVPLSGGFIYTYGAGGSTSATVYQDAALATAHTNPITLDSAGRATIFLAQASYKFIVADSANSNQYTVDNVQSTSYATAQATLIRGCDGRMTLTAATAVTVTDVTAATTVYFTPYMGNRCVLYDGSTWNIRNFAELSLALGTDAANTNYDLFAYDNAGVVTLERLAWTNNTTRATALVSQDGVLVKSGVTTRRYLGTYRTTGTAGQTEDSYAKRFVWNYLHRVPRVLRRAETASTWTYTTASYRQANANTLNAVAMVIGYQESSLQLSLNVGAENSGTSAVARAAIGEDDQDAVGSGCFLTLQQLSVAAMGYQLTSGCALYVPLGYHSYLWLEQSTASGTTTWTGNAGGTPSIGGLFGLLLGGDL